MSFYNTTNSTNYLVVGIYSIINGQVIVWVIISKIAEYWFLQYSLQ
ncbi:MAG: hypothetical protein MJZ24_02860 [Paludibacteraceae bacterium]|nr:hypothetical protein [Candidatus Physcocola equi]MCQ2233665.1 hypothetical protein [Paludibacteraceae bacterium]